LLSLVKRSALSLCTPRKVKVEEEKLLSEKSWNEALVVLKVTHNILYKDEQAPIDN